MFCPSTRTSHWGPGIFKIMKLTSKDIVEIELLAIVNNTSVEEILDDVLIKIVKNIKEDFLNQIKQGGGNGKIT